MNLESGIPPENCKRLPLSALRDSKKRFPLLAGGT